MGFSQANPKIVDIRIWRSKCWKKTDQGLMGLFFRMYANKSKSKNESLGPFQGLKLSGVSKHDSCRIEFFGMENVERKRKW